MWVSGWGETPEWASLPLPGTLRAVNVKAIKRSTCKARHQTQVALRGNSSTVTDRMLCAESENKKTDACQGDSGGPLVYFHNGLWLQIGIVSFAKGCGNPDQPAIYTDVAFFQSWLKKFVPPLQFISPSVVTEKSPEGCHSGGPPRAMRGLTAHAGSLASLLLCVISLSQ
ncbi:tryptase-like [Scyliorhinus canicula]|uniref:tryptase-like n=1 Tax=Scyliorhinus canicula TaxID=7830 RepID=UPI0018F3AFBD|nr:tryptase-like [Scyliorhinus canicula]